MAEDDYFHNVNGDVTEAEDIQGGTTTYTYENNNLTRVTLPDGSETTYTYDIYHNVETATTNTGVVYTLTYDAWGNNTSVAITSGTLTLVSSACYSSEEGDLPEDGNTLISTTDTAGNVTLYGYNLDTNLLEWVQYPRDTESTQTEYTYDTMYHLYTASVTTNQGTAMQVSYGYTNDLLTSVTTKSTTYTLTYNDFSQIDKIEAGDYILASYTYTADQNKYLQRLAYGNGDSVEYKYDGYGRLIKQTWEDGDTVSYSYDNSGALATVTDSATGRTTTYYYDFTDRLTKYVESGADFYHSVSYVYSDADENGELKTLVETINDAQITTGYNYDSDNRVTGVVHSMNLDEDAEAEATVSRGYQYDTYGRLNTRVAGNGTATPVVTDEFTYRSPTTGATSGQVAQFKTTSAGGYSKTYTYTYDANGNITSIFDGTYTTTYAYDSQNQLLREDNENANKTWVWTYDDAGNILSKTQYTYTTGDVTGLTPTDTILYTYGNSQWGDLLTGYDGKTLTYDTVGNLLSDGTWTYTWEHGRQLKSMTNGTKTWTFTYNSDGLRTSRTNGTTTYDYVYNGSQLMQMTVTTTSATHVFHFTYDASGTPLSFTLNGTLYYYATNLQGDVVAVLNASGGIAVDYNYTAWGTHIGSTITSDPNWATIFLFNPLQYRGYVYDWETGLCYLQSRYYNPEIGRFINADDIVYMGSDGTLLSHNLFVYCNNNPVVYMDDSGNSATLITLGIMAVGGLIGAVVSAAASTVTQYSLTGSVNWSSVGVSAVTGFVSGAIAASPIGIVGQIVLGGVIGGASYAVDCKVNGRPIDAFEAVLSIVMGMASGTIGGPGANEGMMLTDAFEYMGKTAAREARRQNQEYASKSLLRALYYGINIISMSAWESSIRFAAGCGISNGVTAWESQTGFLSDLFGCIVGEGK